MAVNDSPAVSVVMPVHNGMPYLDRSLESISRQSFTDFEMVVLDNGSTDGTTDALCRWAERDERVVVQQVPRRLGPVGCSNEVVARARAPLIARMDHDDIAPPDRLLRQVEVLEDLPEVVLVGTLFDGIDESDRIVRPRDRWRLLRTHGVAPFPHGSAMFRRQAFERAGRYRQGTDGWEDRDLFERLAALGHVLVIPQVLYRYRFHVRSTTAADLSRADAATYPLVAANHVWAGSRPPLPVPVAGAGIRRGARSLLYGIGGSVSPRGLRFALREWVSLRDKVAGCLPGAEEIREWRSEPSS